jgi:predicted NBD/HSP70 family sugar kinase
VRTGWLLFTLDTVKEPFFDELGIGDREFNRALGRASYAAIWSLIADAPSEATVIVDAWFGFQPMEILEGHLTRAGIGATAEVWCHVSNENVVARYEARLGERHPGHPGASYLPELVALNERAKPLQRGPLLEVDTAQENDLDAITAWVRGVFRLSPPSIETESPGATDGGAGTS